MNTKKLKGDMTSGPLFSKIIIFALPIAASGILQQLFNSCDVAVVGRFVGPTALAAVGSNSPLINVILNIFMGLSVGANVLIANLIGQKRRDLISSAIHTIYLTAIITGVILLGIGLVFAKKILIAIETPEQVLPLADLYLKIYFAGMPFIMIYNFGSAILRGRGDSTTPSIILVVAGVTNVVLNLLLVILFKMGVAGVGIATTVSNFVSAVLITILLLKEKDEFHLNFLKLKINFKQLGRIAKVGMPAGVQGMVFSLSNVFIQGALNSLGPEVMAGSAAAVNYEYLTYFFVSAFSQSAVTFTSQNFGAHRFKRCRKTFYICMGMAVLTTMIADIFIAVFRVQCSAIYTTDPQAIHYATIRILHIELFQFLLCSYEISSGSMRGLGYSTLPAILTLLGSVAFRLVWLATVFKAYPTYEVLLTVYPVSWILTGTAVVAAYYIVRNKVEREAIKNRTLL